VLGEVAGDTDFADEFVSRYIEGRDVVDYARLLATAGLVLRRAAPGRAFAGSFRLEDSSTGARVDSLVAIGSPAYTAGLDEGDVIVSLGGTRIAGAGDVDRVLGTRKPGDTVPIVFERRGQQVTATLQLIEDPSVEVTLGEQAGQPPTDAQRRTRDAWLSSAARNTF
jgi:predicted metalloprotease with PDZ domain